MGGGKGTIGCGRMDTAARTAPLTSHLTLPLNSRQRDDARREWIFPMWPGPSLLGRAAQACEVLTCRSSSCVGSRSQPRAPTTINSRAKRS